MNYFKVTIQPLKKFTTSVIFAISFFHSLFQDPNSVKMTYSIKYLLPFGLIFSFVVAFMACFDDGGRYIEPYYFPLDDLEDGLVYEYRHPQFDTVPPFYNYFRIIKKKDTTSKRRKVLTYLVGMQYNYRFEPQQLTVEERISNGMLLTQSTVYQTDSTGKQQSMPMKIEVGSAFPFEVRDSGGVFVYNVKWHDAVDSSKFTRLIRNRSFAGEMDYMFNDKRYAAIQLNVDEKVESYDEGFVEHRFGGHEIYAKDIGLVYYRKNVTPDLILEYELVDRYPMSELEKKFEKERASIEF